MRVKQMVGKTFTHDTLGRVTVDSVPKGSRATVNITCIQRGEGWDDFKELYQRYAKYAILQEDGSRSLNWGLTTRDQYGHKDVVHKNSLTLIIE